MTLPDRPAYDFLGFDSMVDSQGKLWEPIRPKPNTVKAAVIHLLQTHPYGLCRRDFALEDIFEVSNRIGELEADGWPVLKARCDRHNHRQRFTLYSL